MDTLGAKAAAQPKEPGQQCYKLLGSAASDSSPTSLPPLLLPTWQLCSVVEVWGLLT